MIIVADRIDRLDFSKLCEAYKEDLERNRIKNYRDFSEESGRELAQQDHYLYLKNVFFNRYNGKLFVYEDGDRYLSSVCFEPFEDGLLLNSLVTVSDERRKGYAEKLLRYALKYSEVRPVYAHIYFKNTASRCLHEKMGFVLLQECAHMLDGSVRSDHFTYILK